MTTQITELLEARQTVAKTIDKKIATDKVTEKKQFDDILGDAKDDDNDTGKVAVSNNIPNNKSTGKLPLDNNTANDKDKQNLVKKVVKKSTNKNNSAQDKGKDISKQNDNKTISTQNLTNVIDINVLAAMLAQDKTEKISSNLLGQDTAVWKTLSSAGFITDSSFSVNNETTDTLTNKTKNIALATSLWKNKKTNISTSNSTENKGSNISTTGNNIENLKTVNQQKIIKQLLNFSATADNKGNTEQTTAITSAGKTNSPQVQLASLLQAITSDTSSENTNLKQKSLKDNSAKNNATLKNALVDVIDLTTRGQDKNNGNITGLSAEKNAQTILLGKPFNNLNLPDHQDDKNVTQQNNNDNSTNNLNLFSTQLSKNTNTNITNNTQVNTPLQTAQDSYDIAGQIIKNAHLLKANENSQMVINLQPEHLGELSVKVSVQADGVVNASFHSDNAQVRNLLQSSIVQLRQDLQQQGIKVDNINVYSGLNDLLSNGQNNSGNFNKEKKKSSYRIHQLIEAAGQMEDLRIVPVALQSSQYTSNGIDYKI
ncbi:flagellar hook-length control protein FliK [Pectinatus sottacetonis]|uniref:flagellar hook-length control protein FliK n=1 Tax=Pectinatus sottacetonis TaxID=1002795 RepID=UPI0018C5943A|nr:flagellar hook-length control protein FliK [Pectinatus sottacetonis]